MPQEKVQAALQLVQEQLEQGHLEPSTSPWNTPIFDIRKKNGDWRLLQDLREVNKTMMPMGALQPGLPSPVAIPKGFHKIVIDIKNCFFFLSLCIPLIVNDLRSLSQLSNMLGQICDFNGESCPRAWLTHSPCVSVL